MKLLLQSIILCFFIGAATVSSANEHYQQQANIYTGVVVDNYGDPLPGVVLLIKGTQKGFVTGVDGKFSLTANPGNIILLSFTGFRFGLIDADLLPNQLVAFVQWGDHQWTNVNQLFRNCINMEYEAVDIPDFSMLPSLPSLFRGCTSMTGNATIGDWDTSNMTFMFRTFNGASQFDQDLSGWDVSNVTTYNFFSDNSGLTPENLPDFP